MKVEFSMRIGSDQYERLFTLPCVTAVVRDEKKDNHLTVTLSSDLTEGRLRANTGDWLVQYKTGKWQVFGASAYETLIHNPKEKPWE